MSRTSLSGRKPEPALLPTAVGDHGLVSAEWLRHAATLANAHSLSFYIATWAATAADPVPDDLADALDALHNASGPAHQLWPKSGVNRCQDGADLRQRRNTA